MASVSSGIASVVQSGTRQLQVQQARRNAAQAEQVARSLAVEAASAQRVADRAQDNARDLGVRSNEANASAGQARQGLVAMTNQAVANERLSNFLGQVIEREGFDEPVRPAADVVVSPAASSSASTPVVNTQGQVTGTLVNTTA